MAYSDSISPKQKSLIEKLMGSLPAKLDAAQGSPVAEQVTSSVAAVQEVLVRVISGQFVTVGQARPVIDVLISADKALSRVAAATLTPGITGADRIIPNKFAKACEHCKATVEASAGHAALIVGRWITVCATCASETPEVRSERRRDEARGKSPATAHEPVKAPEIGTYVDPESSAIVRIYRGNQSGRLNGKRNAGNGWRWTGRQDFAIAIAENKITAQQAAAFGHHNDECVFCGLRLEDPRSNNAGYGPVCAKNNDLPWGETHVA